jgi:hypothetical protein
MNKATVTELAERYTTSKNHSVYRFFVSKLKQLESIRCGELSLADSIHFLGLKMNAVNVT